jgi:hypothetical protein
VVVPSKGLFYGVVAVLVAILIISSSTAYIYYGLYQQKAADSQQYATELNTALTKYKFLSSSFNASLGDYRQTIGLLSDALENLNTSLPAYRNASVALPFLWKSYLNLSSGGGSSPIIYEVDMRVDFGNGTARWFNNTAVQPGWDGYVITLVLVGGKVQASWYPPGYFGPGVPGEHFVIGIDGVNQTSSKSWFVWTNQANGWAVAPTGADGIDVRNGTMIAWTLCGYDTSFNPTCKP